MEREQEAKLIRKYCLYPVLAKAFLLMALLIGVLWLLLVMIGDMVFDGDFYALGLGVYLAIVVGYTTAFCICFLKPRLGMRKEPWQRIAARSNAMLSQRDYSGQIAAVLGARAAGNLLHRTDHGRAGDAFDAMAAVGSVAMVSRMANELGANARLVAGVLGVPIPKAGKYVAAIVLVPVFVLIGVFIPQYISSQQAADLESATAAKTVYALQDAFQQDCQQVMIDDPMEDHDPLGYRVSGYLYSYDEPYNAYISITVENDGQISEVVYSVDVNLQASKEENLENAKSSILKLNGMMNDAHVPARDNILLEECTLPEEFCSRFGEISYYEDLYLPQGDQISVSYMTDSEEDYDEYSTSYIYFRIDSAENT